MDTIVLLENTPLVTIHTSETRVAGIFHILTSEGIDDFTDIKFVSN